MNLPIDFNIPFPNSRTHLSHAGHQCAPPLPSTSEAAAPAAASSSSAPSQTPPSAAQAPATQLGDSLGATGAAPQPHEPPADATAAAISGQDAAAAPGHSAHLARRRRRCHIPERCTWTWRWQWPGQRLSRKQWEAQAILVSRRLLESAAQGPGDSVPAAEVHHQARSPQAGGTTESHRRSG